MDKLLELLSVPGPSGDEGAVADWVANEAGRIPGVQITRIGDNVLAVKGSEGAGNTPPLNSLFAHLDTTGFTLGYDNKLIPIGGPKPKDKETLRSGELRGRIRVRRKDNPYSEPDYFLRRVRNAQNEKAAPVPGTRWVYDRTPESSNGTITAPYLDNRAGVWCALRVLERVPRVAVAFSTGEEKHGHGARICADFLYKTHHVTQALIADLTWHGNDTPCGKGVAISRRDGTCPRQAFLDRVLLLAGESGVTFQEEIQSAGGSDGSHILRSSVPLDWVFVGAPEKKPHTSREQADLSDLEAMTDLLAYLAERL